jgi:hypothetical protein
MDGPVKTHRGNGGRLTKNAVSLFVLPPDLIRLMITQFLMDDLFTVLLVSKRIYKLFENNHKDELFRQYVAIKNRIYLLNCRWDICDLCGSSFVVDIKFKGRFLRPTIKNDRRRRKHERKCHQPEKLALIEQSQRRCSLCNRGMPKFWRDYYGMCRDCESRHKVRYSCSACHYEDNQKQQSFFFPAADIACPRWKKWRLNEACANKFIHCEGCHKDFNHIDFATSKHFDEWCWLFWSKFSLCCFYGCRK